MDITDQLLRRDPEEDEATRKRRHEHLRNHVDGLAKLVEDASGHADQRPEMLRLLSDPPAQEATLRPETEAEKAAGNMHPVLIALEQRIYNALTLLDLMAARQATYATEAKGFNEHAIGFGTADLADGAAEALLEAFNDVWACYRHQRGELASN